MHIAGLATNQLTDVDVRLLQKLLQRLLTDLIHRRPGNINWRVAR